MKQNRPQHNAGRAYAVLALVLAVLLGGLMIYLEEPRYPMTETHQALTLESDWLNVSRPLTADDLAGRIILMDFWTFCCINCIHVVPDLHALEREFGDALTVIGVHSAKFNHERERENIRSAILRYGIEHPVVNDAQFRIWKKFGARAWPTLVLIAPSGSVVGVYPGEGNAAEIRAEILKLQQRYGDKIKTSPLPLALERAKEPPRLTHFPSKVDVAGETIVLSDSGNNRVLVMGADGTVRQVIGGCAGGDVDGDFTQARFNAPQGVLYRDNKIYVADTGNHKVKVIDLTTQRVETISGTGRRGGYRVAANAPALLTALSSPWDLAFYPDANTLAIANAGSHQLWGYDMTRGTLRVLAGSGKEDIDDGALPHNSMAQPSGLAVQGDTLYIMDSETSSLRTLEKGRLTTLIGTGLFDFGFKDGGYGVGQLQHALGVTATAKGLYIADSYNHALRFYDYAKRSLTTLTLAGLREPNDVALVGNDLLVVDTNNHRLLRYNPTTATATEITLKMPEAEACPLPPRG